MAGPEITRGNANADGQPFGHWFVGDLAKWSAKAGAGTQQFGLRESSNVEIKWGHHKTGAGRVDWAPCSSRRTLSLLVSGRFLLRFRSPSNREQVSELRLVAEGDYAIWGSDVEHTWLVEEDATILTVRWTEQGVA